MTKYWVELAYVNSFEIEADDEDEAICKAMKNVIDHGKDEWDVVVEEVENEEKI